MNTLNDVANELIQIKQEQKLLDEKYNSLKNEYIRLIGNSQEPYKNEAGTISLVEDSDYNTTDYDLLFKELEKYLSKPEIAVIKNNSLKGKVRSGGFRITLH